MFLVIIALVYAFEQITLCRWHSFSALLDIIQNIRIFNNGFLVIGFTHEFLQLFQLDFDLSQLFLFTIQL